MHPRIKIRELKEIDLQEGYLIDGFPSLGFSSAIAGESMVNTTKFELAGIIDSDFFPPVSIVRDSSPQYPARLLVNNDLKVGVFLSLLTPDESLHRSIAKTMLKWAKKHRISLIISTAPVKSKSELDKIAGIGSTPYATTKIKEAKVSILKNGTVPGIPGMLLNEGMLSDQNVVVILYHTSGEGPDFKSSAQLCSTIGRIVPGVSCDISSLQLEAKKAETKIKQTEEETRTLRRSMYR
ncbi:MAG: proteasome assembly chaperone family protein [Nitrosopumilaceae archaeon]|nr:proteasome assembly chaperone family protein [Nitrosopumilaceae archaeon]NIT99756.1 proteasome assembly chaperone family protein [Nitrosopumilaceae archaeon]NIU88618.1 proteasome assembly chaperone family protein [Nitrosopumilaceae archaeon]NIV64892.1 proteasome assembly chaperone family protein [Nitrosopumilaceae archaeon]NIX60359.1 proteasome assembly chaperone family protein [Nitrosopumilaceae archaeon]